MSSPVRHVCEHISWYIFVLTATGGLVVLGRACLTDESKEEADEADDDDVGELLDATAAAAAL